MVEHHHTYSTQYFAHLCFGIPRLWRTIISSIFIPNTEAWWFSWFCSDSLRNCYCSPDDSFPQFFWGTKYWWMGWMRHCSLVERMWKGRGILTPKRDCSRKQITFHRILVWQLDNLQDKSDRKSRVSFRLCHVQVCYHSALHNHNGYINVWMYSSSSLSITPQCMSCAKLWSCAWLQSIEDISSCSPWWCQQRCMSLGICWVQEQRRCHVEQPCLYALPTLSIVVALIYCHVTNYALNLITTWLPETHMHATLRYCMPILRKASLSKSNLSF